MGGSNFLEFKKVEIIKGPNVAEFPVRMEKVNLVTEAMPFEEIPTGVFLTEDPTQIFVREEPTGIYVDPASFPTTIYQPSLSSNSGIRFADGAASVGENLRTVVDLTRAVPWGGAKEFGGLTFHHQPSPLYEVYFVELKPGARVELWSEENGQCMPLEVKSNESAQLFPVQKGDTLITQSGIIQVSVSERSVSSKREEDALPTSEFIRGVEAILEPDSDPLEDFLHTRAGQPRGAGRPHWGNHFENWGGIAAHTRKAYLGASTPPQEFARPADSRHLITVRPDGSTVMVAVTGEGMQKGWQIRAEKFGAQVDRALYEDLSLEDALGVGYETFMRVIPGESHPHYGENPGITAIGVEVAKAGKGKQEAHFASLGKGEAVVIRATGKAKKPFAIAYHYKGHNHAPEVDRASAPVKAGDFVVAGLKNIRAEELPQLIAQSGAVTADEVREALMKEEQIRMYLKNGVDETERGLIEDGKEDKAGVGRMLSKSLYRSAYRVVTGEEIPKTVSWPYEEMTLLPNGDVVNPSKNNKMVGHFENGDVSLIVQKVGETVTPDAEAYPTSIFRVIRPLDPADYTPEPVLPRAAAK